MSDYKDSLTRYISKSKSRLAENGSLIQDLLTTSGMDSPANATAPAVISSGGGGGGGDSSGHAGQFGARWGNPDDPNFAKQYLTRIKAPDGREITVHKNAANAFKGFLQALWAEGYHPKSIQSYSNRNIAGTRTKSEHAWANAIDLNPYVNRGDRLGGGGTRRGDLPANIKQLAARYGLTWGGTWRSADPMHFEYTRR